MNRDVLLAKLKAYGVNARVVSVLDSWLEYRSAEVIVEGKASSPMHLQNMIYQGTVLGPPLRNAFYADANNSIRQEGFCEIVFADDLNAYREYSCTFRDSTLRADMDRCQTTLHNWGEGNQVAFDAGKESKHILASQGRGSGGNFKLLGINFDVGLSMLDELHALVGSTRWKIASITRAGRYFSLGVF